MEGTPSYSVPDTLRYTDEHEWAKREAESVRVGVTDYAQHQMGDIVFVELPDVGDTYEKGEEFASLESVKAVSEVYLPVKGKILEVNPALKDAPERVNTDPYGDGWIFKVKISDSTEADALMDEGQYQEYLKGLAEE